MAKKVETVSLAELCAIAGVTRQTLHLWRKKGLPERSISGRPAFVLADFFRWREELIRAEERERATPDESELDKDKELARKLAAEASIKEIELAQRRRDLVPAAEFYAQVEQVVGGLAAVASSQLQRFERDIVAVETPADARRLTQRMHEALMAGAQEFATRLDADDDEPEELAA